MKRYLIIGTAKSGSENILTWKKSPISDEHNKLSDVESIYGNPIQDPDNLGNPTIDAELRVHRDMELVPFLKQLDKILPESDDSFIFTKRITNGNVSSINFNDTISHAVDNPNYRQPLNIVALSISSKIEGNEYNHFQVNIDGNQENPTITITYIEPGETSELEALQDEFLQTPFTYRAEYPNPYELANKINDSDYGKYLVASVSTKKVSARLNNVFENVFQLPDTQDSFRVSNFNYIRASYKKHDLKASFTLPDNAIVETLTFSNAYCYCKIHLNEDNLMYRIENIMAFDFNRTPSIKSINSKVLTNSDINLTSNYPYIVLSKKPNPNDYVIIKVPILIKNLNSNLMHLLGDAETHYGYVYSGKNISIVNSTDPNRELEYDYEYNTMLTTDDYTLYSSGFASKYFLKAISNRDDLYEEFVTHSHMIGDIVRDYKEETYNTIINAVKNKKTVPSSVDPIVIEAINQAMNQESFISKGVVIPDTVENEIRLNSNTNYNRVYINHLCLKNTYPIYFNQFESTYKVLLPTIKVNSNVAIDLQHLDVSYEQYPNLPEPKTVFLGNGVDKNIFTENEYLQNIINELYNEKLFTIRDYIFHYKITDVIILGAYMNSSLFANRIEQKEEYIYDTRLFTDPDTNEQYIRIYNSDMVNQTDIVINHIKPSTGKLKYELRDNVKIYLTSDDPRYTVQESFPLYVSYDYICIFKQSIPYYILYQELQDMEFISIHYNFKPYIDEQHVDKDKEFQEYIIDCINNDALIQVQEMNNIKINFASIKMLNVEYEKYTIDEYINPSLISLASELYAKDYIKPLLYMNVSEYLTTDLELETETKYYSISEYLLRDVYYKLNLKGIETYLTTQDDNQLIMISDSSVHILPLLRYGNYNRMVKDIYHNIMHYASEIHLNKIMDVPSLIKSIESFIEANYSTYYISSFQLEEDEYSEKDTVDGLIKLIMNVSFTKPITDQNLDTRLRILFTFST